MNQAEKAIYPVLMKGEKPTCSECGGPMKKISWGGTDPYTGKRSTLETWRCEKAFELFVEERRRAIADVHARFGEHLRHVMFERTTA